MSETERSRGQEFAGVLTLGALTRAWQILLRGLQDVKDSPRPLASAEMALIRLAYASDLPTPEEALRKLAGTSDASPRHAPPLGGGGGPRARLAASGAAPVGIASVSVTPASPNSASSADPAPLACFEDVVGLARMKRDIQLVRALERDVRLARFERGSIAFSLVEGASPGLAQTLAKRLQDWTGELWMVALVAGSTTPTLSERANERESERANGAAGHPLVRKVLDRFKGARIVDVRAPDAPSIAIPTDDEDGDPDPGLNVDGDP